MKIRKLRIYLLGLLVCLGIVSIFIFNQDRDVINQIQINYSTQQLLNEEFEQELIEKVDSPFLARSDKSFIMGYLGLEKEDNQQIAEDYFELAIRQKTKYSKDISIIYSYKILSDLMIKEDNFEAALEYAKSAFYQIESLKYNDYPDLIWNILRPLVSDDEGRAFSIEALEQVLDYKKKLDNEQHLFFSRILSVLYALDKNYTAAIETNLRAISLSEELNDFYAQGEALVDIAIIVRQIGGYEAVEKILRYIDDSQIQDEKLRSELNVYKLINLAEVMIILNDYDKAFESLNEIQEYESFLDSETLNEIECLVNLMMVEKHLQQGELQDAEKLLEVVGNYLGKEQSARYVDKGILYHIVLGKLNKEKLQYDEAITSFETALSLLDQIANNEYKLRTLDELIDIYDQLGDKQSEDKYWQQRLETKRAQNEIISTEYLNYIDYKFNQDQMMQEKFIIIMITTIMGTLLIVIFIILFKREIYPYLTKLINRKKVRSYLNQQSYFLVYQPIVNPKTSEVIAVEALLRLKIKDKIIMPIKSIKQIEECGMLGEVTLWILQTIINDYDEIKEMNNLKDNFYISMNISLNEIENNQICDRLKECLLNSNLSEKSICLEITENACGTDEVQIKQNLESLKVCGFLIALDDFGVEYSNLSILDKFNFDIIKLDKHFIDFINRSTIHKIIMEVVDYLSVNKKKTIIVEGVESEHQQEIVKNTKSDNMYIQGYFYSKPLELQSLKELVIK